MPDSTEFIGVPMFDRFFSFQCCLPFVKYNNGPASAFWLQQSGFHFRQEVNSLRVRYQVDCQNFLVAFRRNLDPPI